MRIDHIDSKSNQSLKLFRKAAKGRTGIFIEGPKLISEALAAGLKLQKLIVDRAKLDEYQDLLKKISATETSIYSTSSKLITSVSDAVTSQGIISLAGEINISFEEIEVRRDSCFVICDQIQDPGNLGAIFRSASGFGAGAVMLSPDCANPWSPKTIRGSAGACFHLPIIKTGCKEIIEFCRQKSIKLLAMTATAKTELADLEFDSACAIIVGNEGTGIGEELTSSADLLVKIPTSRSLESLNTAVSASIALYELDRKRKGKLK